MTDHTVPHPASFTDELADFRQQFVITDPHLIYLDGNSLGRLPKATAARLQQVTVDEWGDGLIRSWNAGWYDAPQRIGEKSPASSARPRGRWWFLTPPGSICSSWSWLPWPGTLGRTKIVTDELNFPSDLYILQSCVALLGNRHTLHVVRSRDGVTIHPDDLAAAIDADTALVSLSHVEFKSGFMYDGRSVTRLAHDAGALMLWDLCHAVGAVPVELDLWGADLAVGCTYKYLNGGPGSPAFLYVRRELQDQLHPPIWGWFADRSPFAFELDFSPAPGIAHFLVSSPPILSSLAMEAALDVILDAGIERIRRKSVAQTSYLVDLFDAKLASLGFTLGTPRDPSVRGSHVSIRHPEGYRINRALIEQLDLIPDFRAPDNIRLGIAPLYISFEEIYEAVKRIQRVVEEKLYLHYPEQRLAVT